MGLLLRSGRHRGLPRACQGGESAQSSGRASHTACAAAAMLQPVQPQGCFSVEDIHPRIQLRVLLSAQLGVVVCYLI